MMNYKGDIGHVEYEDEAKIFHGEVVGLRDIIEVDPIDWTAF